MGVSKPTDGPVSRFLNRRISAPISRAIASSCPGVNPNHVTIIIFLAFLTPVPLILKGHLVLGGLLVEIASILDGVDGELARMLGKTSKTGAVLDSVLDRIVNISVYISTMLYMAWHHPQAVELTLTLGSLALSGDMLVTYIHSKIREVTGKHPVAIGGFPNIASRDVRLLLLSILIMAGQITLAYILIIAITYPYVAGKTIAVWRMEAQGGDNK